MSLDSILGFCLTEQCKKDKVRKKCAEENGDNYPLQLPMKPSTQACVDAGDAKNQNTKAVIGDVAGLLQSLIKRPNPAPLPPPPVNQGISIPTILGYTALAGLGAGAIYLIYKAVSK